MLGRVIKSTGSWYKLKTEEGVLFDCRIKGKFRLKDHKLTNPVAVGDEVDFELEESQPNQGIIVNIRERKNYLIRKSNKLSSQFQIIASNLDQIVVLATIALPRTTTVFIDRILMAAEAYRIPAILIFNKIDVYSPADMQTLEAYCGLYRQIGYEVHAISALRMEDVATLHIPLRNKVSLITGHSGVGKSSLLNQLNPNLKLKTGGLTRYHQRGRHSTTFAEMHVIEKDTYIIDTPGIKDFGMVEFDKENLSMYFKDIREYAIQCKFNNCSHIDEPGCEVLEAIRLKKINLSRYESYLNIVLSLEK